VAQPTTKAAINSGNPKRIFTSSHFNRNRNIA